MGTGSRGAPWGGRSCSRGWQRPACVAAVPACGRGARGGPSGPGVAPKSLFRPHMGSGLRKWRGSQISEGQGREGRDGRAASRGRASLPTLDAAAVSPPSQTFLGANFRAPAIPAAERWTEPARGIPSRRPEAGEAGGSCGRRRQCCGHAVGSAAGTTSSTLARWESASRLQRSSPSGAQRSVAAKARGMLALPPLSRTVALGSRGAQELPRVRQWPW